MSREKKTLPAGLIRIFYNVPRNLAGKPYIEYYEENRPRKRIYTGLGKPATYEGRVELAERMMQAFIESYVPELSIEDRAWAWIEEQKPNWRKKSYLGYCSKLRNFLRWKGARKMSKELVVEFFQEISEKKSNGTRNDYLRFLKQIYAGIEEEHYFKNIKKLRHYAETCEHYRPSYIRTIFAYLEEEDPELLFACRCIFYLLIRPQSELRLLQTHHFDTDEWLLTVPSSIAKNHRRATVHIPPSFRPKVLEYLEGKGPMEYIFPGKKKGRPVSSNTLANRYRIHMDKLGFGHQYKMYGWKNTGNIEYKKAGADIHFIMRQNRHSSLEITSLYFAKMGWDDRGELPDIDIDY